MRGSTVVFALVLCTLTASGAQQADLRVAVEQLLDEARQAVRGGAPARARDLLARAMALAEPLGAGRAAAPAASARGSRTEKGRHHAIDCGGRRSISLRGSGSIAPSIRWPRFPR